MDLNQIQTLIKFVSKSGVNEVDLETKDFKINIKAGADPKEVQQVMYAAPQQQVAPPAPAPAAAPAPESAPAPAAKNTEATADDDKYVTIKSPMIGTFYRSPNPESPSFVNVGDDIKEGQVICIIEAMKLFNEIESEVSGKVVKFLVDDASPVEYDQPLFLIDPS
ncbi:MAG: acetyl-CoA carboxylase biotin carboxyl carrier protein [Salibacteraceae bacterium]